MNLPAHRIIIPRSSLNIGYPRNTDGDTLEMLEQVFNSAVNPMSVVLDGVLVRGNKALVDHSGYTKDELIGRPFLDCVVDNPW